MDTRSDVERIAFSVDEAATAVGISRATVYRLIDRGELRTVKLGDRRLVPRVELERLCTPDRAA